MLDKLMTMMFASPQLNAYMVSHYLASLKVLTSLQGTVLSNAMNMLAMVSSIRLLTQLYGMIVIASDS